LASAVHVTDSYLTLKGEAMQKHTLTWGFVLMVALGLWVLMGCLSSAEAVLTIRSAAVVNGVAVVEGGNAPRAAPISWEGTRVTQANNGGNFTFQGVVPADCVGRLEDGVAADAIDVALANCGPSSGVPAPVPQTGQTMPFAAGDDGSIRAGVPWPSPRFTDHGNGTVRDNLTGLIWLKLATCFGDQSWQDALNAANALASGSCGLSDGSVAGDWRLPNIRELLSLVGFGFFNPALSNAAGTGKCTTTDCAFSGVILTSIYWSSTTIADFSGPSFPWGMDLYFGHTGNFSVSVGFAWPVRGGD
jgi:hypothetical protein